MNELIVTTENATFVFVTKDTESFTLEEAQEYLEARDTVRPDELTFPGEPIVPRGDAHFGNCDVPADAWQIPDNRTSRHIFRKDLQVGMKFCMQKYGQTQEAIETEARRLSIGGF